METNVRYTIAGIFVLVLVALTVLVIIWLSAGFSTQTYVTYKVYMKESVSGLTVDSTVEFNGVNVGTVKTIAIDQNDPELVELLLRIKSTTPVTEGTAASMNMRGLTGVTFIELRDIGESRKPLQLLPGELYPVIRTTPSLRMRFDQALTQITKSVEKVSEAIEQLLSKENIDLANKILQNIKEVSQELTPLLKSGVNTMKKFNRETIPATNEALSNLDDIMENITVISSELKDNPSMLIRGKGRPALGPGEQ